LIAAVLAALPPLWPGSITTTFPASGSGAGAGAGVGLGAGAGGLLDVALGGAELVVGDGAAETGLGGVLVEWEVEVRDAERAFVGASTTQPLAVSSIATTASTTPATLRTSVAGP